MGADELPDHLPLQTLLLRRERQLEAARRVAEAVRGRSSVDEIVKASLLVAVEALDGRAGSVLLADETTQRLVFQMSVGENPVAPGTSMPWKQGIAGQVFQSGEARVVRQMEDAPEHFDQIDSLTGFKTLNMLALPLNARGGKPFGVMEVLNKSDAPADEDLAVLTIIASFTALAIEQAKLFESARLAEIVHRLQEVNHDIKNMLSPVWVGVDLLEHELLKVVEASGDPSGARTTFVKYAASLAYDAAERIQDRVRLITQYVKGRELPVAMGSCSLEEVIQDAVSLLSPVAGEKSVRIEVEGVKGLPSLRADRSRLSTAFYNLIDNAIPEVPNGGRITIRASRHDEVLRVEVEDTGRGMPPDVRDSIFTERVQSRKAGGTGIGTRIVHDVILAHQGSITVASEEGRGTTFRLELPLPAGSE